MHSISLKVVQHFDSLTSRSHVHAFIVDDSVLRRDRSKNELLARVFDHTTDRSTRGYNMLTLGRSDVFSFAPIDFVMLSSAKLANRFCEMKERLSKRTQGYKWRIETFLRRAIAAGFSANVVLMDSWFTQAPLVRELLTQGLYVIGMVKDLKQLYRFGANCPTLRELYTHLPKNKTAEILGTVIVQTSCGLPIRLVFVQKRN